MEDILNSYINGNFSECIVLMRNRNVSISEFFNYYIDNHSIDIYDLKLLILRLTD